MILRLVSCEWKERRSGTELVTSEERRRGQGVGDEGRKEICKEDRPRRNGEEEGDMQEDTVRE